MINIRFSEIYNTVKTGYQHTVKKYDNLTDLGAFSFPRPITDKEEVNTPHYMMERCISMGLENPIVSSALEQVMAFVYPGKTLRSKSKDEKSKEWLDKWIKLRPELNEEIWKILWTNFVTGNGVLQYKYSEKHTNKYGKPILDNVYALNDVGRLYFNPDYSNEKEKYVYSIPVTVKEFYYDGELRTPKFYNIKYIAGDVFFIKIVYGIPVSGKKISVYKTGLSREGYYGRSSLASCIDVDNIMREIFSSWDTISKLKQIDQKIITPDGNGMYDVANQQYENLIKLLEEGRGSYLFVPFQVKLLQQDIRTSKGYDTMVDVMEFLRRMIMMGLLPQHLTPWGDSSTTQGSEASLPPFLARIKSKQNEFIQFLNKTIINKLKMDEPWLSEDLSFELDAPEVMGEPYYIKMITGLKREGIITPQQAVCWMKHLGIIDETLFDVESVEEKIVDPFKVLDKNAISFKPEDTDVKKDVLRILNNIKKREEEEEQKLQDQGETTNVVNDYMTDNRKVVKDDAKKILKKEKD